jgi:hypothetical protein
MPASGLAGPRVSILLASKFFGDGFGDPGVTRDAAGAAQSRHIDRRPNFGVEAQALASSVIQLHVSRGHKGDWRRSGAKNQEQKRNKSNLPQVVAKFLHPGVVEGRPFGASILNLNLRTTLEWSNTVMEKLSLNMMP